MNLSPETISFVRSVVGFANPDIRYPDLSVNFMAAKNPDILVANPDIRYPKIRIS